MPEKPKLNKHGQPTELGFKKDAPKLHTVSTKPKVIVGGNKVTRPKYDVKKVFKTN